MNIAVKYTLFAIASTAVNLLFQSISFLFYKGFLGLYIAMSFGTVAGLVLKYILDKKFIFFYIPKSSRDEGKKFILYSIFGVLTTSIFWGFEIAFYHMFENEGSKYIGAVVGLSIGYITKYFLDKKFVFIYKDRYAAK